MALVGFLMAVCFEACSPEQTDFTEFRRLPDYGWRRSEPLCFVPEYADSAQSYTISVAVRHDDDFPYANLNLIIDYIDSNAKVERQNVAVALADSAGNWRGGGFGPMYQIEHTMKRDATSATVSRVVIWQGLSADTLTHLTDVGIIMRR